MDELLKKIKESKNTPLFSDYPNYLNEYLYKNNYSMDSFYRVSNITGYTIKVLLFQLRYYASKYVDSKKEKEKILNIVKDREIELNSNDVEKNMKAKEKEKKYLSEKNVKTREQVVTERRMKSPLYKVYKSLGIKLSLEEALKIIEDSKYEFQYIRTTWRSYSYLFNEEEQNNVNNNFEIIMKHNKEVKTKLFKESCNNKKEIEIKENQNNLYEKGLKILEKEYDSLIDLCNENNITYDELKEIINVVKEKNENLYNKYKTLNIDSEDLDKEIIYKFEDMIINDIEENDMKRKIDILDILSSSSKSFKELYSLGIKYMKDKKALAIFKHMINKYKIKKANETNYNGINEAINETTIVDVEFDKFNKVIEGSGRVITKEEKEKIVEFLISNNYPVNLITYKAAFNRYKNGFLILNNNKTLKLTN